MTEHAQITRLVDSIHESLSQTMDTNGISSEDFDPRGFSLESLLFNASVAIRWMPCIDLNTMQKKTIPRLPKSGWMGLILNCVPYAEFQCSS